jgi:flagellar hook protein FlgE
VFGSIFTGLSGMNAFSNALRQISNNITNINSNGFKSVDLTFSGLFGTGGAGEGVSLDAPRLDFAHGELRQSTNDLDLAIDGDGLLVLLRDADQVFARTGSFQVNADGDIVLSGTNAKLAILDQNGRPTPVSIASSRTSLPQATKTVTFSDNLSSTATALSLSSIKVYDAVGNVDTWTASFTRDAATAPGEWKLSVKNGSGVEVGNQTLKFINGVVDPLSAQLTFTDAANHRAAIFDFSHNVTSLSSGDSSTLRIASSDGFAAGDLTGVTVNTDGQIEVAYSNGQKKQLGNIALAAFSDPQALHQESGALFSADAHAARDYLPSASLRVGKVVGRELEASNVDLSKEFGDLILVQRGFQASSQVVSVSNDMIQQLFGIRGQG